jgi:hypothetical protein
MTSAARIAVLLTLGAACSSSGKARSLLPVDLTAAADVGTISEVEVVVTQGADMVTSKRLAWTAAAGQPLKLGLYLPDSVEGTVAVDASAFDGSGQVIGAATRQSATVHPGQTSDVVSLQINRKATLGDGGVEPDGATPDGAAPPDGANPQLDGGGDLGSGSDLAPDAGPPDVATGLTWSTPENLEHDNLSASHIPTVAIDGKGNVLVAWSEGAGLKTKRWDAASKAWGEAKMVEDHGDVNSVTLGMGANGHATLLWNLYPSSTNAAEQGLWSSQSKDGGLTWSPRKLVHNGAMYVGGALAVSRDGNARAAWEESPQGVNSLWSAHYDDVTGLWGDVAMVKLGNNGYDRRPKIAMDAKGAGLLVWLQGDAAAMEGLDSTYGASFEANQPLKNVQVLDNLTVDNTDGPAVAITSDGSKGLAIWVQRGTYELFTAEFSNGGWKAPERFMSFPSFVSDPAVFLDQSATLTAVWAQPLTSGKTNLVAARRPAGQPWGAPTPLETTNQAGGYTDEDPIPTVRGDSAGNVFVAWARKLKADMKPNVLDYSYAIVTRRFSAGMWQPEQVLAMKAGLRGSDPELAVGEDGRAAIAFYYYDPGQTGDADTFNTFASLYR